MPIYRRKKKKEKKKKKKNKKKGKPWVILLGYSDGKLIRLQT